MPIRIVPGLAGVLREVRAAAPLMARLRAPVPACGPWLTAVLHTAPRRATAPWSGRPVAVVVERRPLEEPAAVALLSVARRGALAVVTVLGQTGVPLPTGRPTARLLAADDGAAEELAAGIRRLLASLRGSWALRLTGLPLGDPTLRALAAAIPAAVLANVRSTRLVDELGSTSGAAALRSRDAAVLERWLAAVLDRAPDARTRTFLRACSRLHAAIGQVELAVVPDGDRPAAALLTLVDGDDRWPWWGASDIGGLRSEMGAPLVTLTARGGWQPPPPPVPGRPVLQRLGLLRAPR